MYPVTQSTRVWGSYYLAKMNGIARNGFANHDSNTWGLKTSQFCTKWWFCWYGRGVGGYGGARQRYLGPATLRESQFVELSPPQCHGRGTHSCCRVTFPVLETES